jgi:mono/diheme cytochrome c family protein
MRIGIKKGIVGIGVMALFMTACNTDKTTPGYTYMDDMYRSPSVETYAADNNPTFADGLSAMKPVAGSISRGHQPYEFANTNEGYDSARTQLVMPESYKSEEVRKGAKDLYNNMCSHCHGTKGDGNGTLAEREKFLGIPGYDNQKLPNITPGSIYHVIMHGKGMMGSHASQLTEQERWEIVSYVWYDLRGEQMMASVETEETEETEESSEEMNEEVVTENNNH